MQPRSDLICAAIAWWRNLQVSAIVCGANAELHGQVQAGWRFPQRETPIRMMSASVNSRLETPSSCDSA